MRHGFLGLFFCLGAAGCLQNVGKENNPLPNDARDSWQASYDGGDKAGFGIRFFDGSGKAKAAFFLLDPNKPHDFASGRSLPTELTQLSRLEFRVRVQFDETRADEFIITFNRPLKGPRLKAILRQVGGAGEPIALTFVRQN